MNIFNFMRELKHLHIFGNTIDKHWNNFASMHREMVGRKKYRSLATGALTMSICIVLTGFTRSQALDIPSNKVADYDKRIIIWERPVGYSKNSKVKDMKLDRTSIVPSFSFSSSIVGEKYKDVEETIDTFTYHTEIKNGYESDRYDDKPYLIPYISKNSDKAVIVVPGGGFVFKTIDGSQAEGKEVAKSLNERGISAFVLHYRSNPYQYPIPQLDLQRAIRYLRYNAGKYGLNKNKISILGFSAGGGLVGQHINIISGKNMFPQNYNKDNIDFEKDYVTEAAMIYPCLTYQYNVPMLFASFDADTLRNSSKRETILKKLDLAQNIRSKKVSQFISYGTKDKIVNPKGTQRYVTSLVKKGGSVNVLVADGKKHGYNQEEYMYEYISWLTSKWRKLRH